MKVNNPNLDTMLIQRIVSPVKQIFDYSFAQYKIEIQNTLGLE